MKSKFYIFICLYCILSSVAYGQNKDSLIVNGFIGDSIGQPLEGVKITVTCDSASFTTFTNLQGAYQLKYLATKTCGLSFSKYGYKTINASFNPQPVTTISLPLQVDKEAIQLDEVTVEGHNVLTNGNKTSYLPDRRQRNASHNGVDLLFRLGIPQINVNPMTNEVSTPDHSSISFFIDHRKVNIGEISQLRAKDIKRVEYYENATDLFPGEQKVLNFVLIHYQSGGYVDLATDTRFIYRTGNYSAQASLDHGNMNYTILGGYGHSKDDGIETSNVEQVNLSQPFTRTTTPVSGVTKNHNYNGIFRATYQTKATTIFGQLALGKNKIPKSDINSAFVYSPGIYPSASMESNTNSRNNTFNGLFFLRRQFKNNDLFTSRINYSYGDNLYRRNYQEKGSDIINNNTMEYVNKLDAQLNYVLHLSKKTSLSFFIWEDYIKSRGHYLYSTGNNQQDLWSNEFLFYPAIQTTLGKSLWMSVRAGFDINTYRANGYDRKSKFWPRPEISLRWTASKISQFQLYGNMGQGSPQLSMFNSARQRVNYYEVMQGNPSFGTTTIVFVQGSYVLTLKDMQLAIFAGYNGFLDDVRDSYLADGQTLIHSYKMNGNYNQIDMGPQITWHLLRRTLQLQGGAFWHYQSLTGNYGTSHGNIGYSLSAIYYLGNFNFYAFYRSTTSMLTETALYKGTPSYGLSASWSNNGWKVETGAQNFLTKTKKVHTWFDYGAYAFDSHSRSDSFGPQVYVKLSYSFDFGRKIRHEQIEAGKAPQSGILHP